MPSSCQQAAGGRAARPRVRQPSDETVRAVRASASASASASRRPCRQSPPAVPRTLSGPVPAQHRSPQHTCVTRALWISAVRCSAALPNSGYSGLRSSAVDLGRWGWGIPDRNASASRHLHSPGARRPGRGRAGAERPRISQIAARAEKTTGRGRLRVAEEGPEGARPAHGPWRL